MSCSSDFQHRSMKGFWSIVLCLVVFLTVPLLSSFGQVSVLTQQNDNSRTGQNLQETVLNTSNVNVTTFGKLFAYPVDGYVYGQPLYLPNVTINGQTHNVVYVTTQHNSVYAFDADTNAGSNANPLWHTTLEPQVLTDDVCTVDGDPPGCYTDIMPYIGITATPVIDPVGGTIYLVDHSKDSGGNYHFWLHALDVTTGKDKFGGPTDIVAPGFVPFHHLNRPGLLLLQNPSPTLYLAFGSAGDFFTWNGWVMAYDAQTLQQIAVFNATPDKLSGGANPGGGIWGGGKGLLTDGSFIYVATSNGTFNINTGGHDYASSFLKLSIPDLTLNDFFAPDNQSYLNINPGNVDLGAGGPILLPGTNPPEIVGGGKDGILRVIDTTNMGGYSASANNNVQTFQATNPYPNGMIMGGPVFWNSPNNGPVVYLWGPGDVIKAWQLVGQTFNTTPIWQGTILNSVGISNLAAMSVSANGSQAGTGIVWASRSFSGEANYPSEPGILTAFDATDLIHELWDSKMNMARDDTGEYAKFSPPTIANGKVYLAGFVGPAAAGQDSGQLLVYGLLPQPDFTLTTTPPAVTVNPGNAANYIVTIGSKNGFTSKVSLTFAGCPPNATCSFTPAAVSNGAGTSTFAITTSTFTPTGSYSVTVTGSGSNASHNTTVSLTVQSGAVANFTLSASPSSLSVKAGNSTSTSITVTPQNGFANSVQLACTGLPSGAGCSFKPASVALAGGAPVTSTLTISTTAAQASLMPSWGGFFSAMLLPVGALVMMGAGLGSHKRNHFAIMLGVLLLSGLMLNSLTGCGGGSSSGGGGGGSTPPGSYTIAVTGAGPSGSPANSQTITLNVQ
jgi:hypothetical protein